MELHYKCTVCRKIKFDNKDNIKELLIEYLNKGYEPVDAFEMVNNNIEGIEYDVIYNTEEYFPLEKNDGFPTIELLDNSSVHLGLDVIWTNKNYKNNEKTNS